MSITREAWLTTCERASRLLSNDPETRVRAWLVAAAVVAGVFLATYGVGHYLEVQACSDAMLPYLGQWHGGRCYVNTTWAVAP